LFRFAVLLVALALVVVGGVSWFARPPLLTVKLEVTGKRGLPFQGTVEVDGATQELNGTIPEEFVFEGHLVVYSFTSTDKSGGFQVRALLGNRAVGSAGSGTPPIRGIRGWVKSEWGWDLVTWERRLPNHSFENFPRDDDEGWLAPPP
jgi:hypothetical protein